MKQVRKRVTALFLSVCLAISGLLSVIGLSGITVKAAAHTLNIVLEKKYTNAGGEQTDSIDTGVVETDENSVTVILPAIYGFKADYVSTIGGAVGPNLVYYPEGFAVLTAGLYDASNTLTVTYVPDSEYVFRGRSFWFNEANLTYFRSGEDLKVKIYAPDYSTDYAYNDTAAGYKALDSSIIQDIKIKGQSLSNSKYQLSSDTNGDLIITVDKDEAERLLMGTRPAGWKEKAPTTWTPTPRPQAPTPGFISSYWNVPEDNYPANTVSWPDTKTQSAGENGLFATGDFEVTFTNSKKIKSPIYLFYGHMSDVTVSSIPDQTVNGTNPITPELTITDASRGGYLLVKDKDYTVFFSNNTGIGSATATITGIGDYSGVISENFNIVSGIVDPVKTNINTTTVNSIPAVTYTGNPLYPSVTIKDPAKGNYTLIPGTDYDTEYAGNTNAGTGSVTIKGKGDYEGEITRPFTINPAPITIRANSIQKSVGELDPAFSARIDGLIKNSDAALLNYSFTRDAGEMAGTYQIRVLGQTVQGNYAVTYIPGSLTITEAVPSKYRLNISYLYENNATAAPGYNTDLTPGQIYSINSPSINGYTPDRSVVSGIMPNSNLNVSVIYRAGQVTPKPTPQPSENTYILTINYQYEDGKVAAPSYQAKYSPGASFYITSPSIDGYIPDKSIVSGNMPSTDYTDRVVYKKVTGTGNAANTTPTNTAPSNTDSQDTARVTSNTDNTTPSNTTQASTVTTTDDTSSTKDGTLAVSIDKDTPPKTGDNSMLALWIIIACGCAGGCVYFVKRRRKAK